MKVWCPNSNWEWGVWESKRAYIPDLVGSNIHEVVS